MNWQTALALGRISNLPTVWTNVVAGVVLAGGSATTPQTAIALLAVSLLYVSGMYLNDAFDRDFDRVHRPERPIPAGVVTAQTVFAAGFALLGAGVALLAVCGLQAALTGAALAGTIVLYDVWHKGNPASPALMGACRMLAYVVAGSAVSSSLPGELWLAAAVGFCWLIGLTYIAKQETLQRIGALWPLAFLAAPIAYGMAYAGGRPLVVLLTVCLALWTVLFVRQLVVRGRAAIPKVVVALIAGISLVDAIFVAAHDAPVAALVAVAAFALTLGLQRWVSGT